MMAGLWWALGTLALGAGVVIVWLWREGGR